MQFDTTISISEYRYANSGMYNSVFLCYNLDKLKQSKTEREMRMTRALVSRQTLKRLPLYLGYLKAFPADDNISATKIAQALMLNHVVVRKDLACISSSGKPKVGYKVGCLVNELESYLGYTGIDDAVIIGAGKLGKALLTYDGFKAYGFNIMAAFDIKEEALNENLVDKPLLHVSKLKDFCKENKIAIGVITVPDNSAQQVADLLVECGILAIWNFASIKLIVPQNVLVQNENMAASMAALSKHLSENLQIQQ